MPSLRVSHKRGDIIIENKRFVKLAVKQEIEMMFRMCASDPAQILKSKLSDTLQSVFQQQTCVNGNLHNTNAIYRLNYFFLSLLVRYA